MRTLLLYYDTYHTPVAEYRTTAGLNNGDLVVLSVNLGDVASANVASVAGAIEFDGRAMLCAEQLVPSVLANGCYQGHYYLSAALARPLLARLCVEKAHTFNCVRIVHGFAGNDALRFATGVKALAPTLQVDSVARVCGSRTRANEEGYTVSRNLAGLSIEAGDLEDLACESDFAVLARELGLPQPERAETAQRVVISFADGVPQMLDGVELPLINLVSMLNEIGYRHGVGWSDMVEDGYVGYKTRSVYFSPALAALVTAHRDLERTLLSPALNAIKERLDAEWARLVYRGQWFDPARRALDAFMRSAAQGVSGDVTLRFEASNMRVVARRPVRRVENPALAVFRVGQDFGFSCIDELSTLQAWSARSDPGTQA